MDAVTSGNIQIDSVIKIKYVTKLKIEIEAQNHGICRMSGMLEDGMEAQQILSAMDDIPICIIRSEESSEILFRGIVKKADIYVVNGVYHTDLYAVTLSEMLDRTKCQRSFQNAMMTYEQVIKRVLESYGNLSVFCAEEAQERINEPVIQYGETDWEFLMRLGSHLHIPLYADYLSKSRVLYFGMEKGGRASVENSPCHVGISRGFHEADRRKDYVTRKDYLYYTMASEGSYRIGDSIRIGAGNYTVFRKQVELVHEKLEFTYQAGGCGNWYIPYIDHDRLTGMEFTGKVVSTQAEKMKVGLQIDEPYVGADHEWYWTPVSGNTMYAMPEKGNNVRLYFGSGTASEGTAVSDIRSNGGSMPGQQKRTFTTAAGKKMELHPEHLSVQGGGGQASVTDGQAVLFGSTAKAEMTASGLVRLEAARLHVYTPQEINMYRSRAWCEEKENDITSKGTKSNPPTGTGDAGFTFSNEFNAMSDTGILCAYEFIRYNPFQDAPEEQESGADILCEVLLNMEIGLAVVGSVALLAGYAAAVFFSGGAAAVYAPYVVGGLSFILGSTAVYGVAMNDCKRGEVSSKSTYIITGAIKSVEGAVAGAAICMAPGYAAGTVNAIFPGGMLISNVIIPARNLVKIAMAGTITASSVNVMVKINDEVSAVVGENVIRDTMGAEKYDIVKSATSFMSDWIFWDSIFHPEYFNGNATGSIRQSGMSENGEDNSKCRYTVDPSMIPDDEAAGVLRNGEYVINPTAHNINDYINEGSNYLGNKNMNGQYMYVVDMDGNIIIGTRGGQRMPHPTLVGGSNPQVQAAGMVEIRGGKIYSINNASGHFKPGNECLGIVEDTFSNLPQKVFSKDFQGYLPYGE